MIVVALFLLSARGSAFAADALVTDVQGNRVEVRNIQIAYDTRATGLYRVGQFGQFGQERVSVWQPTGISLYQGDGQVLVSWARILKITIRKPSGQGSRILAEVILRGDASTEQGPVELVQPVDQLIGTTLLGRFSIELANVATIEPLATSERKAEGIVMELAGLTVADRKGVIVNLKVPNNLETPWLSLGAGSVTIPFDRIGRIEIRSPEPGSLNLTMSVDIDGQGRMQFSFRPTDDLQGESNLGSFRISWSQIANIVTQRQKFVNK